MEIRASLDTAILNLAGNVAKSAAESLGVGRGLQVCGLKRKLIHWKLSILFWTVC